MIVVHRTQGDTRTPLGAILQQRDENGVLTAVDLTGKTVSFKMINAAGFSKVALTTATIVTAAAGKVSYDFQNADVDTPGEYTAWFVVTEGGETDHFPHTGEELKVFIHAKKP